LLLAPVFAAAEKPRLAVKETKPQQLIDKKEFWTAQNSPYVISEEIVIGSKGFLNIQPGTTVKFTDKGKITVKGALYAKGLPENPVRFIPYDGAAFYEGILFEGKYKNIVEFCVIIRAAIKAEGGNLLFNNNYMVNSTGVMLSHFAKAVIKDNYFLNNTYGIHAEGKEMAFTVTGNTFLKNKYALYFQELVNAKLSVEKNNFEDNTVDITNYTPVNVEAKDNYWGTADENRIIRGIFDKRNNPKLGDVNHRPFSSAAYASYKITPQIQQLVKYLLSVKKPSDEAPKLGIGPGITGFMPFMPESVSKENSFGLGLNAEFLLNLNGWFMVGVEAKSFGMKNKDKTLYDYELALSEMMVNTYSYIGWKKNAYFVPFVKLGNGVVLISRQYRFADGTTIKKPEVNYAATAGVGAEWFLVKFFSLKAGADYNIALSGTGAINSAAFYGVSSIYFDVPLFLSE